MVDELGGIGMWRHYVRERDQNYHKTELEMQLLEEQLKGAKKSRKLIDQLNTLEELQSKAKIDALRTLEQMQQTTEPPPGFEGPVKPRSMSLPEMMSDPEGQLALFRLGGLTAKDLGMQKERNLMETILRLYGGKQKGGALPLGIDPLSALSMDPKKLKRHPLDEPLSPTEQQKYEPINEQYPKTLREAENYRLLSPGEERAINIGEGGKLRSIQEAVTAVNSALNIVAPAGNVNKKVIAQLSMGDLAFGPGREVAQLLDAAVTTKVLIVSGVTAREDEKRAVWKQYVPSLLDLSVPGLAERKLQRLRDFMSGALDLATLPPSLAKRIKNSKQYQQNQQTKEQDFSGFSAEEM